MRKTREYKYQTTGRLGKEAIQTCGEVISRLAKQHEGVTAEIIVLEARHPKSPLHPFFEWDDTAAAAQFRLEQARSLIRKIEVELKHVGGGKRTIEVTTRAFRAIDADDGERRYQHIAVIQRSKNMRQQVIDRLSRELTRIGEELKVYRGLDKYALTVLDVAAKLKNGA